jgi:hypothetical protein
MELLGKGSVGQPTDPRRCHFGNYLGADRVGRLIRPRDVAWGIEQRLQVLKHKVYHDPRYLSGIRNIRFAIRRCVVALKLSVGLDYWQM